MQALESLTETQVSGCETKSSMGRGCRGPSRPHPVPSSPPLPSPRSPPGGVAVLRVVPGAVAVTGCGEVPRCARSPNSLELLGGGVGGVGL